MDTNINIGSLSTTGYDINVGYTGLEMGRFGSLAFNLTGTYLVDLITQPVPGLDIDPDPTVFRDTYDCTGFYSTVCGTPNPQWRHRFRTSWQTPWDVDLSLTWRHYGAVTGLDWANNECRKASSTRSSRPRTTSTWPPTGPSRRRPGHARYQQRAGRQPVDQRRGWHDGQRQHLPADLRRPRSLRLPAGDGGLLRPFQNNSFRPLRRRSFGTAAFFFVP